MAHVQLAFYFFWAVWIPVQEGRRIFQRIRTTRNELDRFADATEEQLENKRNEDEPCSICLLEFMSSAKITPCEHYFHYDCLAKWLYKTTNCPYCRAECVQNVLQGNGIH
jgi:E3 ubiquitin-protein ligase RNF139